MKLTGWRAGGFREGTEDMQGGRTWLMGILESVCGAAFETW